MQGPHPKLRHPTAFLNAVENNAPDALDQANKVLDSDFRMAILLASWHGHEELVKGLVHKYENLHPGYRDKSLYGEALAEACEHNHWRIVEFLIEHDANPSFVYHTPLVEALKSGSDECINILLKHINPQQITQSLIEAVIKSGHQSSFQMLLSHIPTLACSASCAIACAVEHNKPWMAQAVIENAPKLKLYQESDFVMVVVRAAEKNDDASLNALVQYLHEETLDRAHAKMIDLNHRKKFTDIRHAHKTNKLLHEKLSMAVEQTQQIRARKM
jgi:hypothetical protein